MAGAGPAAPADTLYFGGGTPTLLSLERLGRVVEAARSRFALAADAEITVEANPRDLDDAGYRRLRELGASRLSLGVQSFDDAVLGEMGRKHSAAEALGAFEAARQAGFGNISIDLILGWPGETPQRWRRTLRSALALGPDHVSLYVLEVEGRTLLAHRRRRGTLALPPDDLVADLYLETVASLAERGLERYEISNFARAGFESRHNAKYWNDDDFLGLGLSAHSYLGGLRFWNLDSYGAYCRGIEQHGPRGARAGERRLVGREALGEALFTGLRRREGVSLSVLRARYGVDPLEAFGEALEPRLAAGLLEAREDRLCLSERGVLLSNEVFEAFV